MDSKFAPAERSNIKKLIAEFEFLSGAKYIEKLINALPYIGAILNSNREVLFANDRLLEILNLTTFESILGQRPGEVLHCIHAKDEIGGCGTSESCRFCGAVNCILEAQKTKQKAERECRVTAKMEDKLISFDFHVTTSPFQWKTETFYIFSLVDISSEKRRRAMERIFFHDVLNKTGSMYGFIDLIRKEKDIKKIHKFIDYLDLINNDLTSEIQSQRDLSSAENGELKIKIEKNDSLKLIKTAISQIQLHDVAQDKKILLDDTTNNQVIYTDGVILRRILLNMLKNALEETEKSGEIEIGCNSISYGCVFWVNNHSVIPREGQLHIFQRSYSTKGVNRGLGTYSMKLLGEQYLKGKVGFTSDEKKGTTFFIEIPLRIDY